MRRPTCRAARSKGSEAAVFPLPLRHHTSTTGEGRESESESEREAGRQGGREHLGKRRKGFSAYSTSMAGPPLSLSGGNGRW